MSNRRFFSKFCTRKWLEKLLDLGDEVGSSNDWVGKPLAWEGEKDGVTGLLPATATNTSNGLPVDIKCHMEEEEEGVRIACFLLPLVAVHSFPACFLSGTRRLFDSPR